MHRVTAVLICATVLAGCNQSLNASADAPDVTLAFGIHRNQGEAPFLASGGDGEAVVKGFFLTPCSPYEARAEIDGSGSDLILNVIGENKGDCPQDAVTPYGYQATVSGLKPGTYRLRVRHQYRDANWPTEVVFATDVVVR